MSIQWYENYSLSVICTLVIMGFMNKNITAAQSAVYF